MHDLNYTRVNVSNISRRLLLRHTTTRSERTGSLLQIDKNANASHHDSTMSSIESRPLFYVYTEREHLVSSLIKQQSYNAYLENVNTLGDTPHK